VRCITNGIFLIRAEGEPIVIVVSPTGERGMGPGKLRLEGVGASEESVAAAIAAIRGAMREHNVFRGRVISLHGDDHSGGVSVQFHTLRSEEHTSELQSRRDLVCRLLLEKKKKKIRKETR